MYYHYIFVWLLLCAEIFHYNIQQRKDKNIYNSPWAYYVSALLFHGFMIKVNQGLCTSYG